MNEKLKESGSLSTNMISLSKLFGRNFLRKIFQSKVEECEGDIGALGDDSMRAYRLLSDCLVRKNKGEQLIIEDLLKSIDEDIGRKKFEKFSWQNRLLIINGGKSRMKFDLEMIKKIPIEKILQVHSVKIINNNVFKLRNERTPSCSFNRDKNLWMDHGTGEGGSVIDLYMIINDCKFKEAITALNNFL